MDRVFTPGERHKILESGDPDRMLWSLWAGKETAYKAVRRYVPSVSSAPGRYEVHLPDEGSHGPESGTVDTPSGPVSVRFCITNDYIHCLGAATDKEVDAVIREVRKIPRTFFSPDHESDFVREIAKRSIAGYVCEPPEAVDIFRPKGCRGLAPPVVQIAGCTSAVTLSMSHDGRYAAFAFSVCPERENRL
jgi:phosphopantetheinyl transferase (holo-ACP synthase)